MGEGIKREAAMGRVPGRQEHNWGKKKEENKKGK